MEQKRRGRRRRRGVRYSSAAGFGACCLAGQCAAFVSPSRLGGGEGYLPLLLSSHRHIRRLAMADGQHPKEDDSVTPAGGGLVPPGLTRGGLAGRVAAAVVSTVAALAPAGTVADATQPLPSTILLSSIEGRLRGGGVSPDGVTFPSGLGRSLDETGAMDESGRGALEGYMGGGVTVDGAATAALDLILQVTSAALPSALAVLIAYFLDEGRPKGWSDAFNVSVRPSLVPGAGLGLFAMNDLKEGHLLGEYPGSVVSEAVLMRKVTAWPAAKPYIWQLDSGDCIDPTDRKGQLGDRITWLGSGLFAVSTALARVNEPPPSGDCSVRAEEQGAAVKFYTTRFVRRGEELYIDYGRSYERGGYGTDSAGEEGDKEGGMDG